MARFYVSKRVFEDYEVIVEADNADEVYDIIADGVEWTFIQSDDEGLIIEPIIEPTCSHNSVVIADLSGQTTCLQCGGTNV